MGSTRGLKHRAFLKGGHTHLVPCALLTKAFSTDGTADMFCVSIGRVGFFDEFVFPMNTLPATRTASTADLDVLCAIFICGHSDKMETSM